MQKTALKRKFHVNTHYKTNEIDRNLPENVAVTKNTHLHSSLDDSVTFRRRSNCLRYICDISAVTYGGDDDDDVINKFAR